MKPNSVFELENVLTEFRKSCLPEDDLKENTYKLWYAIGRNPSVYSCKDAAEKRTRLGYQGIPIWDELKTIVQEYIIDKRPLWVAIHLRGDRQICYQNLHSVLSQVGQTIEISNELQNLEVLNMQYGAVNPFTLHMRHHQYQTQHQAVPNLLHILDEDLFVSLGPPDTLMTNAGNHSWSLEFYPSLLRYFFPNALRGDISIADVQIDRKRWGGRGPRSLGIITGNTPESGALLWDFINRKIRYKLTKSNGYRGDISFPNTIIHSIPDMGLSMELGAREEQVWHVIHQAVLQMANMKIDTIAIACNTTQYFTGRIRQILHEVSLSHHNSDSESKERFISMPECLAKVLKNKGIREVGLIGIWYVTNEQYSAYFDVLRSYGIKITPSKNSDLIYQLAYKIKAKGPEASYVASLRSIIEQESAQHVVIALTEFSHLLASHKRIRPPHGKVLIDSLIIYAEAIASSLLNQPFPDLAMSLEELLEVN